MGLLIPAGSHGCLLPVMAGLSLLLGACGGDGAAGVRVPTAGALADAPGRGGTPTATVGIGATAVDGRDSALGGERILQLPREDGGSWGPMDLVRGDGRFVVEYEPEAHSREEQARSTFRLGLLDAETGDLEEFRALPPGDQAISVANDGRYVAWVERSTIIAPDQTDWRLCVLDLTNMELRKVDESSRVTIQTHGEIPRYDPDLAVDSGRLVYAPLVRDSDGTPVYEIRLVDLGERTMTTLKKSGDASVYIWHGLALSGDLLLWTETVRGAQLSRSMTLRAMRLDTGEEWTVGAGAFGLALRGQTALAAVGNSVRLLDVRSGDSEWLWGSRAPAAWLHLTSRFAYWVDTRNHRAMAYDLKSREVMEVSDSDTVYLFADEGRVAWLENPNRVLYLHWIDLAAAD